MSLGTNRCFYQQTLGFKSSFLAYDFLALLLAPLIAWMLLLGWGLVPSLLINTSPPRQFFDRAACRPTFTMKPPSSFSSWLSWGHLTPLDLVDQSNWRRQQHNGIHCKRVFSTHAPIIKRHTYDPSSVSQHFETKNEMLRHRTSPSALNSLSKIKIQISKLCPCGTDLDKATTLFGALPSYSDSLLEKSSTYACTVQLFEFCSHYAILLC